MLSFSAYGEHRFWNYYFFLNRFIDKTDNQQTNEQTHKQWLRRVRIQRQGRCDYTKQAEKTPPREAIENISKFSPHVNLLQMSKKLFPCSQRTSSVNRFLWTFSIYMTDNTSVIYLLNEGGDEDFHLLSIHLLAANTPKIQWILCWSREVSVQRWPFMFVIKQTRTISSWINRCLLFPGQDAILDRHLSQIDSDSSVFNSFVHVSLIPVVLVDRKSLNTCTNLETRCFEIIINVRRPF